MPKPTADDMRAYRDKHECGLYEAKAKLMQAYMAEELNAIKVAHDPVGARLTRLIELIEYTLKEGPSS